MPNRHFGRPDPLTFADLLEAYPDSEFERLTRSTVPLLCYWKELEPPFNEVCQHIGCAPPESCDICFEYWVPAWGGNTPSYTDIMCVSAELGVAIEGKSTEGQYKTVGEWLGPHPTENKQNVLRHWLQWIGQKTGLTVEGMDFAPFDKVTYQMIHRTASACSLGANRTAVVYQVFKIGEWRALAEDYYQGALQALVDAIGAKGRLDILLHYVRAETTGEYRGTLDSLSRAEPKQIRGIIRQAILNGGLFKFARGNWKVISTSVPANPGA
jgi:hypothetical protein